MALLASLIITNSYIGHFKTIIIALQTLLPLVTGPFVSFLKPSQLHGEYTAYAAKCVVHRTTLNQSQQPFALNLPFVTRGNYS